MIHKKVILMGNPNVGKSTLFNKLTGKRQHTGNWAGKTVETATGTCKTKNAIYSIVDLPGIYSLSLNSPEEKISKDYLLNEEYDTVLIICDATDLYRGLKLTLEVLSITQKAVLCVNMLDEAARKGIKTDLNGLSVELGIPVIGCVAKKDVRAVKEAIILSDSFTYYKKPLPPRDLLMKRYVTYSKCKYNKIEKHLDSLICGKYTRIPVMLIFLLFILWLTVSGANYPSLILSRLFSFLGERLRALLIYLKAPALLLGITVDGAYCVMAQVVAVMFPPMAIFFPLFALLEQSGILPRIALNADKAFKKCGGTGKQALTMCMGLGCNAVGVVNSRIIPTQKQRLIAILTNSFMPCNGRFPTLIFLISVILRNSSSFLGATLLTVFIIASVAATLLVTLLLSKLLKGNAGSPVIELTPYRRPDIIKTVTDSFLNQTLHVLARAVAVAAPAGAVLWLLTYLKVGDASLIEHCTLFLTPPGKVLCMDSVILLAFILGTPANETVLPIAVMIYTGAATLSGVGAREMTEIFLSNGWNAFTALSVAAFSIFHWPCATTLLTVKKETKSVLYTLLAAIIPTAAGVCFCLIINALKLIFTG